MGVDDSIEWVGMVIKSSGQWDMKSIMEERGE